MPYIVTNSDGSLTVNVADSVVDTSTYSLALLGRNVSNYGQYIAQNTIRSLENFASATAPSPSQRLVGQLWYDKTEQVIRVWDGTVWKRNTGIILGASNNRPTTSLSGGGTAFFNTTNNKLEIHNGTEFREAGYAGEVTSRYSASGVDNQPSAYGTRIRNIFLKDTDGISNPVLAVCYVKSTSAGSSDTTSPNRGSTLINGQYETIMSLWSDRGFVLDVSEPAIVDGITITDLSAELVAPTGIAAERSGRAAGQILPGHNTRAEFETSGVTSVANLFADNLGSDLDPIGTATIDNLTVKQGLTVGLDVPVILGGDLDVADELTVGGDITASTGVITTANLVVSANTTLNGVTSINGNLYVNGAMAQTIGQTSNLIENYYGDDIQTQTLTVATTAGITTVNAGSLNASGDTHLLGNLNVQGEATLDGPTTIAELDVTNSTELLSTLSVSGTTTLNDTLTMGTNKTIVLQGTGILDGPANEVIASSNNSNFNHYVTFSPEGTGNTSVYTDGGLRYNSSTNTLTAGVFDGVATSAQYADLAEIYKADAEYAPGTVVKLGGSEEITQTTQLGDTDVFGVISTDPAYLMNSKADGQPVAMTGRVPVLVTGKVEKGERLISSDVPGVATGLGATAYDPRMIIGRALEEKTDDGVDTIEAVVGIK